jgi:citrate synthase
MPGPLNGYARWPEALVAALATATGVRHAAACDGADRLWAAVRSARGPARWVKDRLAQGGALEGFEAGAYPDGDPRGERLLALIKPELSARTRAQFDELLSAVQEQTGQFPSVDLGLCVVAQALRLPAGSASVLFVIGRTAGWLAHIEEQAVSGELIRPRARFVSEHNGE